MSWEALRSEVKREDQPEVLRFLSLSIINHIEKMEAEIDALKKAEAERAQLSLALKEQATTLRKLIYERGREKRNVHRPRSDHDSEKEKLLLHAESLTPALRDEVERSIETETQIHEASIEELLEVANVYGYADAKPENFEEISGLDEISTEMTMVERRYKKIIHRRKKYRFKPSVGTGKELIITADGPPKLFPGSRYSIDFALSVVIDKYLYHLPLERQRRQMEEAGLTGISVKTLYALCQGVSVHLEPVIPLIKKDIFSAELAVHADETPWPIVGPPDDDGYLWCISNQAGSVYQFEPTRSGKIIEEMLEAYQGPVLHDGFSGYKRLKKVKGLTLAACWAHARRKFFEIQEFYPAATKEILDLIDELFAIERKATNWLQLQKLRTLESKPLIGQIHRWLLQARTKELKQSKFTRAVFYCLKLWVELTAFLNDNRIPLSNNDVERALRHSVMGRKNFNGSKTINGADVMAVLYSVIETCKKAEIPPTDYIKDAILKNINGEVVISPLSYARALPSMLVNSNLSLSR